MNRIVRLGVALMFVAACTSDGGGATAKVDTEAVTLRLVTHDSFAVSKEVLRAFTAETGITVKVLRSGDAGEAV
ncbi:MAG: thiamine transport system substrate-binding protein, partial [Nocardioidaceae bacterium]|nr:thiamine transport system substrate-binding protein [Nocardioidaceae bacterium]